MKLIYKTLLSFVAVQFIFILNISAQQNQWIWIKSPKTKNASSLDLLCTSPSNKIYCTGGYIPLFIINNDTLKETSSRYILSFTDGGEIIWEKSFKAESAFFPSSMNFNSSLFITGNYSGDSTKFDSFPLIQLSHYTDIFIVKQEENSKFSWVKSYGGNNSDLLKDITFDGYNIFFTGITCSDSLYFDSLLLKTNKCSFFIGKMDRSGKIYKVLSNSDPDYYTWGESSTVDNKHNLYLGGNVISDTCIIDNIGLFSSLFLAKFDTNLNIKWARQGERISSGLNGYVDLVCDQDNNIYGFGYFSSRLKFGDITLKTTPLNQRDYFLIKYDGNGNVKWVRSAGGEGEETSLQMALDKNNYLYILCNTKSKKVYFENDSVVFDTPGSFIAQYDTSGNFISITRIENSVSKSLAVDMLNNIYVGGKFMDSAGFDGKYIYGGTGYNMFIAKMKPATSGIASKERKYQSFQIYPNPNTNGNFVLKSDNISNTKVEILFYNSVGSLLYNQKFSTIGKLYKEISIPELTSGIYFIKLTDFKSNLTSYSKVIVVK